MDISLPVLCYSNDVKVIYVCNRFTPLRQSGFTLVIIGVPDNIAMF